MSEVRTPTTHLAKLRAMTKDLSTYVFLDGVFFKEEQLVKMAVNAGSFAVAEHYLCAYLAHGLLYGRQDVIDRVNEVRQQYQVLPFKKPENLTSGNRSEYDRGRMESVELKVRKAYGQMTKERRQETLRSCLQMLRMQSELFNHKNDWMGIMLVLRDRLDGSVNQNNFSDLARKITPDDWPDALHIGDHTSKNFSRLLEAGDRTEAYYDMDANPQARLCDKFWEIVIQAFLTENP